MTPKQRAQALILAETLQVNPTEVNLNAIVKGGNLQGSWAERFTPWVKARWAEPRTKDGLALLLTAVANHYLSPAFAQPLLDIGLGAIGLQAMVTKG